MKAFKKPAKLAGRVIAPGDGTAEPGVTTANLTEPAELATDVLSGHVKVHLIWPGRTVDMFRLSPTSWAGPCSDVVPQARLRHRLGLSLCPPASQAG
ncbi:MAG: hypothetical protein ACRD9S_19875 [Pyrinomonadaceae bacterium]